MFSGVAKTSPQNLDLGHSRHHQTPNVRPGSHSVLSSDWSNSTSGGIPRAQTKNTRALNTLTFGAGLKPGRSPSGDKDYSCNTSLPAPPARMKSGPPPPPHELLSLQQSSNSNICPLMQSPVVSNVTKTPPTGYNPNNKFTQQHSRKGSPPSRNLLPTHSRNTIDVGMRSLEVNSSSNDNSRNMPLCSGKQTFLLSKDVFNALNKNPVSALNELVQKNGMTIEFEKLNESRSQRNKFTVAVNISGKLYDAVTASNMKDARRDAADAALRVCT